jgi:nucleotide-binding universal stress UspA family protein
MLTIKHILFPMDFSDRCCGAIPFVKAMAARFGAKITLINALQPFYFTDPSQMVMINTDQIIDDLRDRLEAARLENFPDLPVDTFVALGDPAQVILDFARNNAVGLIMMPTHGYGPFRSLLLGSVTAKVLHDAQCPVWTGAHMEGRPSQDHVQPRNIMCAVDGTPRDIPLIQRANELCNATGAQLRLVHVIPSVDDWPEEARRRITRLQQEAGVDAPLCVAAGHVDDRVREEARRHAADLLVIGRGVLQQSLGRLRTHAHAIIRNAPCPVLSV